MGFIEDFQSFCEWWKDYTTKGKCEKLIKYQNRILEFKSMGIKSPKVELSLADFKTEIKKVEEATECAKSLDDFQYLVCTSIRELEANDPDRKMFLKRRLAAIALLTGLRNTLVVFQSDPSEEQKKNLYEDVKGIRKFMKSFVSAVSKPTRAKPIISKPSIIITMKKPQIISIKEKSVFNALEFVGLKKNEMKHLINITDSLATNLPK